MNTRSKQEKRGRPSDESLKVRRQEEIMDEAAKLFAEFGYHDADIQVLADRLEVGKGTIYRYFPSKEDLFLAAVDRAMLRLKATVDEKIAGVTEPLEQLSLAIHAYLAFFSHHREFVELLILERAEFKDRKMSTYFQHRDANLGPWRELFRSLIAEGRVRDMPVERIINVLSDLLYGTMFTTHFTGRRSPFAAQANDILDVLFHGILTAPAKQNVRDSERQ